MAENDARRQPFTFSMRIETIDCLTKIAEKFNTTNSRMVENLILSRYKQLFNIEDDNKKDLFEV